MTQKILVTYATRYGSTAGIAEAIGNTLREDGTPVDVLPMIDVNDLTEYQAVVAGSAIQGGIWLPEALQFLSDHQKELAQKPFAAFLVCMTLTMGAGKYRGEVSNWLAPVRALVKPVSEGLFAGMLDFRKLPVSFKTLAMGLTVLFGVWPRGDRRDWNAVRAWAAGLQPLLKP